MFPFRYSSIFRRRWIALFWAAGICWTAADVAKYATGTAAPPANGADADADADGNASGTASTGNATQARRKR